VNTLLVDPPAAPGTEQPPASGSPSVPPEGASDAATPAQPSAQERVCAHCGTPLQEGQQWCLQCGASEPGSLGERPNWRPLTVLALLAALLAAGAAVAGAAALSKHNSAAPHATALVPTRPALGTSTATPAAPLPTTTPGATGAGGAGTHTSSKGSPNNLLFPPSSTAKPPKLPSPAPTPTPKASGGSTPAESTGSGSPSTTTPAKTNTTETGTSTTESTKSKEGSSGKSEQPNPILLDTNAATTYNPYNFPEAGFGDPGLAIDGEPSTAWTAQVQPASFPNMAEGLLINLRSATKLGRLELATPTRGMTVQVYGANGAKAPTTITEPGWTLLSGSHVLKKKVTHLRLHTAGKAFSLLLVWIVKAPPASQGTATAPGHVALSEVALYPPAP
jgi:hypothetical protein